MKKNIWIWLLVYCLCAGILLTWNLSGSTDSHGHEETSEHAESEHGEESGGH